MNPTTPESNTSEGREIGWIATAEVFLLGALVILVAASVLNTRLAKSETQARHAVKEKADREKDLTWLRGWYEHVSLIAEQFRSEADGLARENDDLAQKIRDAIAQKDALDARLRTVGDENRRQAEELKDLQIRLATAEEIAREHSALLVKHENLQRSYDESQQTIAHLSHELRSAQGKAKDAEKTAMELQETLLRLDKRIFDPIRVAKLVVMIRCPALPPGFDLDLFVQDPNDELCYWRQPRIMTGHSETGIMVLSEDIIDLRGRTEEAFYSTEVLHSGQKPYLVFCMLRSKKGAILSQPVKVNWEITYRPSADEKQKRTETGMMTIGDAGWIVLDGRRLKTPGLTAICGFQPPSDVSSALAMLSAADVPRAPRGWDIMKVTEESVEINRYGDQRQ